MLKVRVLSAAVLLPIAIISIILGGWYFSLFIVVMSFLACAEYVQMLKLKSYALGLPAVLALCAVWQANAMWGDGEWFVPAFAAIVALITFGELIQRHMHPEKIDPTRTMGVDIGGGIVYRDRQFISAKAAGIERRIVVDIHGFAHYLGK